MKEIHSVLVVGAGVMGHGIALVCAKNGLSTELVDVDTGILKKAMSNIERFLEGSVARKKMTSREARDAIGRINPGTDLEKGAAGRDFVIEAVVEDFNAKTDIFQRLDACCQENVIFASNTSQISITELSGASGRPDRFCGMHWFNPPPLMRLIEIPTGVETAGETVETVVALSRRLGKKPMVCKDSPGFVVNRILSVWHNEGMRALDEGVASIEDIDRAIRDGGGFPMGPFELRDLLGLDVGLKVSSSLYERLGHEKFRPAECIRQRVAAGHLGRKTGQGFYRHDRQ